ncbi:MAG: nuclear transport factor 2 family protein [Nitrolancea sp.]
MTIEQDRIEQQLLELEDRGWTALSSGRGADFYDEHLTDDARMVFPFGVMDRTGSIEAMRAAPPWSKYLIEEPTVTVLTTESAVLTYRATAQREGQPEYRAWMSSIYVRRGGQWKLAVHQQTPLQTS